MPYGTIKVDNITFTNGGSDTTITVSGLASSTTGNLTVTGTISGAVVRATTVSGVTVTGTTVQGASGTFTSITGGVATITSGVFAAGSATNPSISFTGDNNTGIYSPGADQVAISTGGSGRLFVRNDGFVAVGAPTGDAALEIGFGATANRAAYIDLTGDTTYADYGLRVFRDSSGANAASQLFHRGTGDFAVNTLEAAPFIVRTNNTERLRITSGGLVGVGTSSPTALLHVSGGLARVTSGAKASSNTYFQLYSSDTSNQMALQFGNLTNSAWSIQSVENGIAYRSLLLNPSGGSVGIGITNPGRKLTTSADAGVDTAIQALTSVAGSYIQLTDSTDSSYIGTNNGSILFLNPTVERARIDSSGRLLVGTSSAYLVQGFNRTHYFAPLSGENNNQIVVSSVTTGTPAVFFTRTRGATPSTYTVVQDGDNLGLLEFFGADGTDYSASGARITCQVDGTPGDNDMPGRLVFSTTADGASSPTERMRITSTGEVTINGGGPLSLTRSADTPLFINRTTNDGSLVSFAQDGVTEGSISVSGTTVSYNGAHLSRWSQLPSGAERIEILRGTVLSNINEMCEWGEESNEQLNRMKVSDVEGDKNVSGVFQAWDDDDDTYVNDFYCAMTGDFIIRIGAGVTVERGDLLMSAGDGTAKPQDDDIIRSKTIAKVTSTNVSCTYEDGSYCVPCVLMAC